MTWALVQTGNSGNTYWTGSPVTPNVASFPAPVTSGNFVIGHFTNDLGNGPVTTVTDDKGNSYTIGTAFDITGDNQAHGWFYRANITNAPQTITVNFAFPNIYVVIEVWEVSGLTASPVDVVQGLWQSAPGSSANAVHSDATGTATTAANEVGFGFWLEDRGADARPIAAGTGWTLRSQVTDDPTQTAGSVVLATETQDIPTSGTLAKATFTAPGGTGEYSTICVTLKLAAAGISLSGSSSSIIQGMAGGAGVTALRGRSSSQSKNLNVPPTAHLGGFSNVGRYSGKSVAFGVLALAARSANMRQSVAGINHPLPLGGRSFLSLQGKIFSQGIIALTGQTIEQFKAQAFGVGASVLTGGRSSSQSKGRAGPISLPAALAFSGRSAARFTLKGAGTAQPTISIAGFSLTKISGKAAAISAAFLAALSASQSKGRGGITRQVVLRARSASQAKARALVSTGQLSIAGRSLTTLTGKAAGAGASPLSARAASQSKGRASIIGQVFIGALRGRAASQSKGRGTITGILGIAGRSTSQAKGQADLDPDALLRARGAAQGKGRGSSAGTARIAGRAAASGKGSGTLLRTLGLQGRSLRTFTSKATGIQMQAMTARSASQAKGRPGLAAFVRLQAILGRAGSQSTGRGGIAGQIPMAAIAGRAGSQSKSRGAALIPLSPFIPGYFPPISPWVMPYQPFDAVINAYGIALTWERSHQCSCLYGSFGQTGSPDPQCQTCHGLGWYWDEPFGPFQGLITFIRLNPSPDEPGALMNEKWGVEIRQEPTVTIPFSAGIVWEKASVMDRFVEVQALDRFNTVLIKGGNEDIPYSQQLTVAPTGAVTIYDEVDHQVIQVVGYTVNGTTVTIPDTYPEGTAYTVEFIAAKTYIAWRGAGAVPHDRPFGQVTEPKRFRFQTLDLWLRSVKGSDGPLRFSRLSGRSLVKTAGKALAVAVPSALSGRSTIKSAGKATIA